MRSHAASLAPCLPGSKPPPVGTVVRCSSSNRSNQFTTSIEELERQLGASKLAAHGAQQSLTQQRTHRTTPTSLVPPLRRPAPPPEQLQQSQNAETKASAARSASPIQLAQLAQQLRMRVRAVQDLVDRCPQLLALSPWQLDAAVMGLSSELGISSARALFMVSKDPHLLFMGRAEAPLQEGCLCEGGSRTSTTDLGCSTSSTSSSRSRQGSRLSSDSAHSGAWVSPVNSSAEHVSSTGSKRPAGSTYTSSKSSTFSVHAPNTSPAARAATLAQALGVKQEEVMRLAASAPSVLSRPPGPLAAKFRRLVEVLEGVPMACVLRMASGEPSYLSYRPPSIDRRIQAMRLLFRKPRHKIVHMLTRQPDLVFMSPRILHNKLKVLQRIFNKEPRLVVPIIMRTPKLLRTDMDKVRECYELLEGLMGLPSRSYTFAMVCHAPALLLEGKTRLVGRARCISHAIRGAPHWAKQWRKLYPAQRADCMLVTPVTYSRLEFLIATGQARSLHVYDALMMARSDFSQLYPTFRPIPIRRPSAATSASPARPINTSATSVAPLPGDPQPSASGSTPINAPLTSGVPAAHPHFGSTPTVGAPAAPAAVPTAVPVSARGAAAAAVAAAAASAASKKPGLASAQPLPPPPWTPVATPSHASMRNPVLPNTPLSPAPINPDTHPAKGASGQALKQSRHRHHYQQQQQQLKTLVQPPQQQTVPLQGSWRPHQDHTHQLHSAHQQHQRDQHLHSIHEQQQQQQQQQQQHQHHPLSTHQQQQQQQQQRQHDHHKHKQGQSLSQPLRVQVPSGLQGHLETQHGSDMKLIGHRSSRRMRHQQKVQTVSHHTNLLPLAAHLSPQPAASTPRTPSTNTAVHLTMPSAEQVTGHLATQLPEPKMDAVQGHGHLDVPANDAAIHQQQVGLIHEQHQGKLSHEQHQSEVIHQHQGEVIHGLLRHWRNPRPLQPTLEFSTVAYAVRQGHLPSQHARSSGRKDAHEVLLWEKRGTGSSWVSRASNEHRSGSNSSNSSSDSWEVESREQGSSSRSSSSSRSAESVGSSSNGLHDSQRSRQQSKKASVSNRQGTAESEGVLSTHHHHTSHAQRAAPLPLAAAQH